MRSDLKLYEAAPLPRGYLHCLRLVLSVQKLYEAVITSHSFHNLSERSQLRKCIQSPTNRINGEIHQEKKQKPFNKRKHEPLMRIVEPFNKERHELQMRIIQPPRRITESLLALRGQMASIRA